MVKSLLLVPWALILVLICKQPLATTKWVAKAFTLKQHLKIFDEL